MNPDRTRGAQTRDVAAVHPLEHARDAMGRSVVTAGEDHRKRTEGPAGIDFSHPLAERRVGDRRVAAVGDARDIECGDALGVREPVLPAEQVLDGPADQGSAVEEGVVIGGKREPMWAWRYRNFSGNFSGRTKKFGSMVGVPWFSSARRCLFAVSAAMSRP